MVVSPLALSHHGGDRDPTYCPKTMTTEPEESETGYRPTMSTDIQKRTQEWHDQAYTDMTQSETIEVTCLGVKLTVPPQVYAPPPMPPHLSQVVQKEVHNSDRVLDMGTGSGINAILAAARSSNVVAVDINPYAVERARANAEANGVADRIQFIESDVFDRVEGRFDLIIFDPPFRWFPPRDLLEAAIADEGYRALTRFLAEARIHLNDGGRILVNFGTSGDVDYLISLIERNGFKKGVVSELELATDDWTVHCYVFA